MTVGTDPENIQKNCQFIKFQKCNFLSHFLTAALGSTDSKFCYCIATSYERANYGIFIEVAKIGDQATTKTSPGQEEKKPEDKYFLLPNSQFWKIQKFSMFLKAS